MEEWKNVVNTLYKRQSGQSLFNTQGNFNKKTIVGYVMKKAPDWVEKLEENKMVSVEIPEVMTKDGEFILSADMLQEMGKLSIEDILYMDDAGNLHIRNTPDALVKLAVKSIDNLIQSFQNQIAGIEKGQHNDRISKFKTAEDFYDIGNYTMAKNALFDGINELEGEMKQDLDVLCKLPRSALQKIFCRISIKDAKLKICKLMEGVTYYVNMLELIFKISEKTGENLEIIYQKRRKFIQEEFTEERLQRLVELTGREDVWCSLPDKFNEAITGYIDLQRTKCIEIVMEG